MSDSPEKFGETDGAKTFPSAAISWHRGAIARGAGLLGKAGVLGGITLGTLVSSQGGTASLLGFGGLIAMALSYAFWLVELPERGELTVVGTRLVVQRGGVETSMPLSSIASAYLVHRFDAGAMLPHVEIRTRLGTVLTARMPNERSARELVEQLGYGPGGKVVTIPLGRKTRRMLNPFLGLLAFMMGIIGSLMVWSGFIDNLFVSHGIHQDAFTILLTWTVALLYVAMKAFFAEPVIRIGHDGITVKRLFRTKRIPRSELAGVSRMVVDGPVVIERRDGDNFGIDGAMLDAARTEAVADVATQRFAESAVRDRATVFERGGRAIAEWRTQIRSMLDPGYRSSAASGDDAAAVLASPSSTVDQRLGAALALRIAGEPKERIRIAAEGATDPHVRIALEAIAEDEDDEHLEKALRRLR